MNRGRKTSPINRALVACDGNGNGCVLAHHGEALEYVLSEWSRALDGIGLDDAPHGLRIWEGVLVSTGSAVFHGGEIDENLEGRFRELTAEEWDAVSGGYSEKIDVLLRVIWSRS